MGELADALGLHGGIVAAIGAGGMKSVLNELAASARGRVARTGTVFTARPPRWTGVEVHYGDLPGGSQWPASARAWNARCSPIKVLMKW